MPRSTLPLREASRRRRGGRGPGGSRTGRARASAGRPGRRSTSLRTRAASTGSSSGSPIPTSAARARLRERLAEHGGVLERAGAPRRAGRRGARRRARAASPGRRARRSRRPAGTTAPSSDEQTRGRAACAPSRRRRAARPPRGRGSGARSRAGRPGTSPSRSSSIAAPAAARGQVEVKLRWPAPQVGPPLGQLRPREREDEQRVVARPLEQVLDEVEQALRPPTACPRRRARSGTRRRGARRTAATRRTGPARSPVGCSARPSSWASRGSTKRRSSGSGTMLLDRRPQLLQRRARRPSSSRDPAAHPHHVGERPVGRRPPRTRGSGRGARTSAAAGRRSTCRTPTRAATCRSRRCP